MVATRRNYSRQAVEAARSVLLELAHLLGEYRDDMVLVGGWVPELLLDAKGMPHVGSTDVDLALDHQSLEQPGYELILALLVDRGYQRSEEQPFIFYRVVRVEDAISQLKSISWQESMVVPEKGVGLRYSKTCEPGKLGGAILRST